MSDNIETIKNVRQVTLSALKAHDGHAWKESAGELHYQNKEIPNWILLFEDSDPAECHRLFTEIVAPFMEQAGVCQFTVSYTVLTNDQDIQVEFYNNNDEILEAANTLEIVGKAPFAEKRGRPTFFENLDSSR